MQLDEVRSEIAKRRSRANELETLDPAEIVTCEVCGGTAPDAEHCECGGTQTVEAALEHLYFEIDLLANH